MKLTRCIQYLFFAVACMVMLACDDSEPEVDKTPALAFVESSIPAEALPFAAGEVFVNMEWAYTTWNVSAADVVEGAAFITAVTPSYGGSADEGATTTKIKIVYKENKQGIQNRQKVVLKSIAGDLSQEIIITQKPIEAVTITVKPSVTYQTIAGFGGANVMWGTSFLSASEIKSAFGTGDNELGMSILRVRLAATTGEWAPLVATLKEAKKYNAKILATPWSPPANLKDNNNLISGHLLEANYAAYATYLDDFVQYMAAEGVTIDAVSVQNEPDIAVNYESCDWTAAQLYNFAKNHAGAITGTKVAMSESFNFKQSYTDLILNDATAVNNIDIVAGHIYGGGLAKYSLAEQKGKELWMTEYLMNQNSGNGSPWVQTESVIWAESMQMLTSIHQSMAVNWNAYIWWYTRRYYSFLGDGEQGTTLGSVLKRGYAMSQFSKFVRPGYVRIDAQPSASSALNITAYSGDGKIVVVIINPSENAMDKISIAVPGSVLSAVAYTTSVSQNRQMQTLTPGNVTVNMAAKSVTTVVLGL